MLLAGMLLLATSISLPTKTVYDFTVKDIDGKKVSLDAYKGKVLLFVNVASLCGNTPQYKDIQALYAKYKDKGLVVLGFPSNDFGKQEPGTNAEIAKFCTGNYNVDFPMFSKIVVKGEGINPLYGYLTSDKSGFAGPISWNFEKFLIGRDGKVVKRFAPKVKPDAPEVIQAIEAEIAKK